MSKGSRHDDTGWLNDVQGQLVLRRDAGGQWRLDMGFWQTWQSRKLLGQRVRVTGVRDDFDILAVDRIAAL